MDWIYWLTILSLSSVISSDRKAGGSVWYLILCLFHFISFLFVLFFLVCPLFSSNYPLCAFLVYLPCVFLFSSSLSSSPDRFFTVWMSPRRSSLAAIKGRLRGRSGSPPHRLRRTWTYTAKRASAKFKNPSFVYRCERKCKSHCRGFVCSCVVFALRW